MDFVIIWITTDIQSALVPWQTIIVAHLANAKTDGKAQTAHYQLIQVRFQRQFWKDLAITWR
jgi:hypothetical protein